MALRRWFTITLILLVGVGLIATPAMAKKPSLDAWKPAFDPKGAKYR